MKKNYLLTITLCIFICNNTVALFRIEKNLSRNWQTKNVQKKEHPRPPITNTIRQIDTVFLVWFARPVTPASKSRRLELPYKSKLSQADEAALHNKRIEQHRSFGKVAENLASVESVLANNMSQNYSNILFKKLNQISQLASQHNGNELMFAQINPNTDASCDTVPVSDYKPSNQYLLPKQSAVTKFEKQGNWVALKMEIKPINLRSWNQVTQEVLQFPDKYHASKKDKNGLVDYLKYISAARAKKQITVDTSINQHTVLKSLPTGSAIILHQPTIFDNYYST